MGHEIFFCAYSGLQGKHAQSLQEDVGRGHVFFHYWYESTLKILLAVFSFSIENFNSHVLSCAEC
jgi:hypothetical protein